MRKTFSCRKVAFLRSSSPPCLRTVYPQPGWHEHHPKSYLESIDRCIVATIARFEELGYDKAMLRGVGITNQRETTVLWDRTTGEPIYNAGAWSFRSVPSLSFERRRKATEGIAPQRVGWTPCY